MEYGRKKEAHILLQSLRGNFILGRALRMLFERAQGTEPSDARDAELLATLFPLGWLAEEGRIAKHISDATKGI